MPIPDRPTPHVVQRALPRGLLLPASQGVHSNDPASAAFVLAPHSSQAPPTVEAVLGFLFPVAHLLQSIKFFAPTAVEYVPCGQGKQAPCVTDVLFSL